MKAFLMYRDRDFDLGQELPANAALLREDLELETLFAAMAGKDEFLAEIVPPALLTGLSIDIATIEYRQAVLHDCMENAEAVNEIYALVLDAIVSERKNFFSSSLSRYPSATLHHAVEVLKMFIEKLRTLRDLSRSLAPRFRSDGFTRFFRMIRSELTDAYFAEIKAHLKTLDFRHGVLVSAGLGPGLKGENYVLRREPEEYHGMVNRLFHDRPRSFTIRLHPRDEAGAQALGELRGRGLNLVANAVAQSTEHILDFFRMLRRELAFYLGCLNLKERMDEKGMPLCFPRAKPADKRVHRFRQLYDICLALTINGTVVANDGDMDGKDIVVVTGANRGGKSTFLRSVGLAQLMMQCGMFVPAESFSANICSGLFTHYKREEDTTMESGKFDEELKRMDAIADGIGADALVLFNESFSATNEKEGSEIARQIVDALLENKVKIVFVTHFYDFAGSLFDRHMENALFLRAERKPDGTRTLRVRPGEPLETSYGQDLYREVFGEGGTSRGILNAAQ